MIREYKNGSLPGPCSWKSPGLYIFLLRLLWLNEAWYVTPRPLQPVVMCLPNILAQYRTVIYCVEKGGRPGISLGRRDVLELEDHKKAFYESINSYANGRITLGAPSKVHCGNESDDEEVCHRQHRNIIPPFALLDYSNKVGAFTSSSEGSISSVELKTKAFQIIPILQSVNYTFLRAVYYHIYLLINTSQLYYLHMSHKIDRIYKDPVLSMKKQNFNPTDEINIMNFCQH